MSNFLLGFFPLSVAITFLVSKLEIPPERVPFCSPQCSKHSGEGCAALHFHTLVLITNNCYGLSVFFLLLYLFLNIFFIF